MIFMDYSSFLLNLKLILSISKPSNIPQFIEWTSDIWFSSVFRYKYILNVLPICDIPVKLLIILLNYYFEAVGISLKFFRFASHLLQSKAF